jgi:hypothetical protein
MYPSGLWVLDHGFWGAPVGEITSSRFIVTVGLPPGQQVDWHNGFNFYVRVDDHAHPTQSAIYLFGTVADTAVDVPMPQGWSITTPGFTLTPQPLCVDEWSGTAIYTERNQNYAIDTKMWIGPDILKGRVFAIGLHVSINKPDSGTSTTSMSSYPLRLRAVSPDVKSPGITEKMNKIRRMFIPPLISLDL